MKDPSGWGRYPRLSGPATAARDIAPAAIARGLVRSCSDAAIGRDNKIDAIGVHRMRSRDGDTGILALGGLVITAGGRVHLPKDAPQSRNALATSYPNLERIRRLRAKIGAADRMASDLSERLGL